MEKHKKPLEKKPPTYIKAAYKIKDGFLCLPLLKALPPGKQFSRPPEPEETVAQVIERINLRNKTLINKYFSGSPEVAVRRLAGKQERGRYVDGIVLSSIAQLLSPEDRQRLLEDQELIKKDLRLKYILNER